MPANLMEAYIMIAAVTWVMFLSILLFRRGFGRRAHSEIQPEEEAKPAGELPEGWREIQPVPLLPIPPTEAPPTAAEPVSAWNAALEQARNAFRQGDDKLAIATLFDTAVASLSAAAHVRLAVHMTHSEKSWAIQAALPGVKVALRELTNAYELVNYGDRSLTQEQRDAALNAFDSLHGQFFSTRKE